MELHNLLFWQRVNTYHQHRHQHGKTNYFFASLLGFIPSFFITNTIGAGLNTYVAQAKTFSMIEFIMTPEIYLPILMFVALMISSLFIKKKFFDNEN